MSEIWRPVRDFEDHYLVSNLGTVKRISPSRLKDSAGRIVRPYWGTKRGSQYARLHFNVDGRSFTKYLHIVVFEAFHGPIPRGLEVNHKDGKKRNCREDNLEAGTHQYNIQHATRLGLNDQRGEQNSRAKLTESAVLEILAIYKTGRCGIIRLAKFFNTASATVRQIVQGKTWTYINRAAIKPDWEAAARIRKLFPQSGPRLPRQLLVRSERYLRWIRSLPCCVCQSELEIEASHTGPHGLSVKSSDFSAIPLCSDHHRTADDSYHRLGPLIFQRVHQIDIKILVLSLNERGPKPLRDLSPLIPEIRRLRSEGLSYPKIAAQLSISTSSAHTFARVFKPDLYTK